MEQLITRYTLPGLPFALVLYLSERLEKHSSYTILDITFALTVAILLGNVIQQLWMLIFESPRFGFAYNSKKRRVLVKLSQKLKDGAKRTPDELYARWESFLYSKKVEPSIRDKDRGIWHSHHTNAANSLGFLFGSIASFGLSISLSDVRIMFIGIGISFSIISWLFLQKAFQTRHLVEILEEFWIDEWYEEFAIEKKE